MSPDARTTILVFAKAPDPGKVKTRLASHIGEGPAAVLAARLALRTLATACEAGVGDVELWCAPDTVHPFFDLCRRRHGVALHVQVGDDLGARMNHALNSALQRTPAAILIGSDIPGLAPTDLRLAAASLAAGDDAVFGPAEDGGYWLIGLSKVDEAIFADMPWGGSNVLSATRERCGALGWSVTEIATRWDVDRPEDFERLRQDPTFAALTVAFQNAA
ncbi:MAG: TIGR04282 family arsenosugar biosynthesis glycosyltransferase [Burkholderiales bacterium]|nr:TIGR04282 family arsenosugar biosynthesis glycosyltransferase [Burkholderiales bacterium]